MIIPTTVQSLETEATPASARIDVRTAGPLSLFQRMFDVRKIVASQAGVVRVAMSDDATFTESDRSRARARAGLLESLAQASARCGVEPLRWQDSVDAATNVELAVRQWLDPERTLGTRAWSTAELERSLETAQARTIENQFQRERVRRPDGATLSAYSSGDRSQPPLVLVIPCGMPLELSRAWLEQLGRTHFVVTWESRGMFDLNEAFDTIEHSVSAQCADVFAVMDHYGIRRASVMALCVGAVSTLMAAAQHPERVTSLVFGNGFFSLPGCPKTDTERNLLLTATRARVSRPIAARMHEMFMNPGLFADLDRSAHCTFYPYATPELLYRYGTLCGALHAAEKAFWIEAIVQPTLVITGLADTVVHPDGSCALAHRLRHSTLQCEAGDDHLDVFEAGPKYVDSVRRFLTTTTALAE